MSGNTKMWTNPFLLFLIS